MKTTALGVLTIVVAVANAVISFLKVGTFDFATTAASVTAGWGLIKAHDAAPATVDAGKTNLAPLAWAAALILALCSVSCMTATRPDGTVVRQVDEAAVKPWREFAREVWAELVKKDKEPAIEVPAEVLPAK